MNQALGFQDYELELRLTERGLAVFSPPAPEPAAPIPSEATVLDFEAPDRVTVRVAPRPQGPLQVVMHMVPLGPGACRQEWLVAIAPATPGEPPKVQWSDAPHPIFEQDRLVLESVQRAVALGGHGFERSVEADAPTLLARRVYAAVAQGRWPDPHLTSRRLLKVRT
jgi:hypothetical protein